MPVRRVGRNALVAACWLLLTVASSNAVSQSSKPADTPKPVQESRPVAPAPQPHAAEPAPRHEPVARPEPVEQHGSDRLAGEPHETRPPEHEQPVRREELRAEQHGRVAEHGEEHKAPANASSRDSVETERNPIFEQPRTIPDSNFGGTGTASETSRPGTATTSTGISSPMRRTEPATVTSRDLPREQPVRLGVPQLDEPPTQDKVSTLHGLNAERTTLVGINRLAIPEGRVRAVGGLTTVTTSDRRSFTLREDGTLSSAVSPNATATFTLNGRIASLKTHALSDEHLAHGMRVMTMRRPDGTSVTRTGPHSGYVAREIDRDGQRYAERTYLAGKRIVRRNYWWMSYGGQRFWEYLPRHRYSPAFYGWLREHRHGQVPLRWPWPGRNWLVSYRFYFVPMQWYDGVDDWLADFVLGETLEDGSEMDQTQPEGSVDPGANQVAADEPESQGQAIGTDLKQQIAVQIEQDLVADEVAAPVNEAMTAAQHLSLEMQAGHVFIVDRPMGVWFRLPQVPGEVRAPSAPDCTLSPGDVIRATKPMVMVSRTGVSTTETENEFLPPTELEVMASRTGDCAAGEKIQLNLSTLQEMENAMRARVDDGLVSLARQKDLDGVPAAPIAANGVVSVTNPLSEANVSGMLRDASAQVASEETQFVTTVLPPASQGNSNPVGASVSPR